jgi:hypothetical protein
MDAKVVAFYRDIFADLTVDREEAAELNAFLASLNPPPDKLLWIRATAFRIAAEFLSEDSKDANVSLLRTVNYLVHAVEANCMQAKELDGAGPVDPDVLTEFYTNIFADHQIVSEENAELVAFFKETSPPDAASMTTTRALAFKAACENLSEENDKEHNVQLLRCVNAVVHAFELTCLTPNPFELHDEGVDLSMGLSEAVQHVRATIPPALHPFVRTPHSSLTPSIDSLTRYYHSSGILMTIAWTPIATIESMCRVYVSVALLLCCAAPDVYTWQCPAHLCSTLPGHSFYRARNPTGRKTRRRIPSLTTWTSPSSVAPPTPPL